MKKLVAIFPILAIPLFVLYPLKQETIPATLEKSLPWLHVEGNQIVYENGSKVILRGVAIEDPYFLDVVASPPSLSRGRFRRTLIELAR